MLLFCDSRWTISGGPRLWNHQPWNHHRQITKPQYLRVFSPVLIRHRSLDFCLLTQGPLQAYGINLLSNPPHKWFFLRANLNAPQKSPLFYSLIFCVQHDVDLSSDEFGSVWIDILPHHVEKFFVPRHGCSTSPLFLPAFVPLVTFGLAVSRVFLRRRVFVYPEDLLSSKTYGLFP